MTFNIRLSNYLPFSLPIDRCRGIRSLVEHARLVNMRERLPWQRSSAHSARVLFVQFPRPKSDVGSLLYSAAHRWHHCVRGRRIKIGRSHPAFVLGTVRSSDGATVCAEGGDSQRPFSVYFKAHDDCAVRIEAFTAFCSIFRVQFSSAEGGASSSGGSESASSSSGTS